MEKERKSEEENKENISTDMEEQVRRYIEQKQQEELQRLQKQRAAFLNEIAQSDVDSLAQRYMGTQEFPMILELKRVEYLETIAYALSEMIKQKDKEK